MADCSGQCETVRWSFKGPTTFTLTADNAAAPKDPKGKLKTDKNDDTILAELKQKAQDWCNKARRDHECPTDCHCDRADIHFQTVKTADTPISIEFSEGHDVPKPGGQPGTVNVSIKYTASATVTLSKERGTAECMPDKMALGILVLPGLDVVITSDTIEHFPKELVEKIVAAFSPDGNGVG
jgi:hypothetical protein